MKTNLKLAHECGAALLMGFDSPANVKFTADQLDAFAERIRLDERERCALACKTISDKYAHGFYGNEVDTADECENAIRKGAQ